ncbi:uncharacterized protein TRIADDRAFT_58003 [Trichoplax adhaerens]|uniref:General transcription factor 3C polypeptide 3 n=1 Tax=Trichoplax adhaerens TaxID=10228 RepID=B3S2F1_TRIAD|nr:hypothetical protein TRIADDRAFT_58003 [Trichoplax adhaerens]EDV23087.1 hypothetical protein TRIADDRAFT_58003 [Trichoplax adhaerens]|eukprot:XP_002113997.1 hypothetical protein TRIADDRAFT_58003 [Trichoplax adhaerens]
MNDQDIGDINSVLRYLSGQISFNEWSQSGALPLLLDGHIPPTESDTEALTEDEGASSDNIDEADDISNASEDTDEEPLLPMAISEDDEDNYDETDDEEINFDNIGDVGNLQDQNLHRNIEPQLGSMGHAGNEIPNSEGMESIQNLKVGKGNQNQATSSKIYQNKFLISFFEPYRKRNRVPDYLTGLMGEANLCLARGNLTEAEKMCKEIIRQAPHASDPYETLAMIYEENGDEEKVVQLQLIAAYLNRRDASQWVHLAQMSLEQDNKKQALWCYNMAVKADHGNIQILNERARLCIQMDNIKGAAETFEMILRILKTHQGMDYFDYSKQIAKLHHSKKRTEKSIEVLERAFRIHPEASHPEAINMLAELYVVKKEYKSALELICCNCGFESPFTLLLRDSQEINRPDADNYNSSIKEPQGDRGLSILGEAVRIAIGIDEYSGSNSEIITPNTSDNSRLVSQWKIPNSLPIDLRIKAAVCLLYLDQSQFAEKILQPLYLESIEEVGDLYLDIADAYYETGNYISAMHLYETLVGTEQYNAPAVWLSLGKCQIALNQLENAVESYSRVVGMAPEHSGPRSTLASLYQQLGQPQMALQVLTERSTGDENFHKQSDSAEIKLDLSLLVQKCNLLSSQNNLDEFAECGLSVMAFYLRESFGQLNKMEEINSHRTEIASRIANIVGDEAIMTNDEWWALFLKVCLALDKTHRYADLLHIDLSMLCASASYLNSEYDTAYLYIKPICIENSNSMAIWYLFNNIVLKLRDIRHIRFCNRLFAKNSSSIPLCILNGHNSVVSGSYKFALADYVFAFCQMPDQPLLALCIANTYLHMATQRTTANKNYCILQGIAFLYLYKNQRGSCQEAYYNVGRAYHQLGLFHLAVHYYRKALLTPISRKNFIEKNQSDVLKKYDLSREAAYNLSLIYRNSGSEDLARHILYTYCSI